MLPSAKYKLLQKPHVAVVEQTDVWNCIAQHGDSVRSHSERPSGVALGIDAGVLEHGGMYHPAAKDLHPACPLARRTPYAMAELAFNVHFRRWFGEGKERRAEAHLGRRSKESVGKVHQRGLEIDERNFLIYRQAFDLGEGRRVGWIERIIAVDQP